MTLAENCAQETSFEAKAAAGSAAVVQRFGSVPCPQESRATLAAEEIAQIAMKASSGAWIPVMQG